MRLLFGKLMLKKPMKSSVKIDYSFELMISPYFNLLSRTSVTP